MGAGLSRPKIQVPGTDMAGIVESVGKNVTRFKPGDAVFGQTIRGHQWTNGGALAEYVSAWQETIAMKPANVTFEQAASVPTSGFIALLNLRSGTIIEPGQKVLINGAGGGVGSIALQVAKARGAHVTAVDSTRKLDMLRSLGADEVIDYTKENVTQGDVRYDFIFDVPGTRPFSTFTRVLEPGGRYVPIGHEGYGVHGKRVLGIVPHFFSLMLRSLFVKQLRLGRNGIPSQQDAIVMLKELLETGQITPIVDSTYPLSDVRNAFRRMMEAPLLGKIIITPTGLAGRLRESEVGTNRS
jgi:NADPH:quinone reductase-like Zn-dependent oxidoreductase